MVFLIQASQNRDSLAIHLKLDEIIKVIDDADNALLHVEDKDDDTLNFLHEEYKTLGKIEDKDKKNT